jgi:hypothetical protein
MLSISTMTYDPRATHKGGWDLGMHFSGVIWEPLSLDIFIYLCKVSAGLTWPPPLHASFLTTFLKLTEIWIPILHSRRRPT